LFVICDLATNAFDIEPIKSKDAAVITKAMLKCFSREYVKQPYASIKTDGGSEFKSVFHKWLYDHDILHKVALADRHKSMSVVESLNKQLGRFIMGYLSQIEEKTGKISKNWLPCVDIIRKQLNEIRIDKSLPKDITSYNYPIFDNTYFDSKTKSIKLKDPKYKIGDMVYRAWDAPRDNFNKKQNTAAFRQGDVTFEKEPREIINIFYMSGSGPCYRYYLNGLKNVSYTEQELMKAPNN
jgi:hypothetical protein